LKVECIGIGSSGFEGTEIGILKVGLMVIQVLEGSGSGVER
jgi:hypothetical protein